MVVVQESAEPIATHHPTLATTRGLVRRDQPAAEALMVPFPVVVGDVLGHGTPQVAFSSRR